MKHGVILEGHYLINIALCCSAESVASPLHQWSTLGVIGCVCTDRYAAIGRNQPYVKFDWSVLGKAKRHSVVIFFFPVQQKEHMFQVNKLGVNNRASVFKAEKTLDILCFILSIQFIFPPSCGN